ncbi:hypothetical protein QJS10_CPB12g01549 [Acorus calamus]|uniref:NADP-dependent oxidoreductase domain-containing protein n=1 Tax=Acorus calamus TaxID=4465 RepID=A0AAV9DLS0_ACOCL|nr:hypothetical protein QJS10_CPB12g01549 [Acorus calamus]
MAGIPELALVSGQKIPVVGFGTMTAPLPFDQLVSIFLDAIEAGYRHFDTALAYPTEQPLDRAMEEALQRGLIESRDELFITSKVWCTHAHCDLVLPSIKETLSGMIALILGSNTSICPLHFPVRLKHKEISFVFDKEDIIPFEVGPTWEAMEECQRLGLTMSIGVSNFTCKKLTELLSIARIHPVVNQVHNYNSTISRVTGIA